MKNIFSLMILMALLVSCHNHSHDHSQKHNEDHANHGTANSTEPIDIIGKTIEYRYGESVYHVHIDNESEMHWEAMAGDEKGVKEEETYKMEYLDNTTIFITWGEANGIGVSQVLDFEKGVVHNHLLRGRDISIGKGEIQILE